MMRRGSYVWMVEVKFADREWAPDSFHKTRDGARKSVAEYKKWDEHDSKALGTPFRLKYRVIMYVPLLKEPS